MFGDVPRLRINCGDRFGDLRSKMPFSGPSGEGDEFPVAEFRLEDPILTSR